MSFPRRAAIFIFNSVSLAPLLSAVSSLLMRREYDHKAEKSTRLASSPFYSQSVVIPLE